MGQKQWFKSVSPQITLPLFIIIGFLFLIGLGNIFGLYQSLATGGISSIFVSLLSVLLYVLPAYGLLKLNRWARLFEIALSFFLVILGLIMIFTGLADRSLLATATQGTFIVVIHGTVAAYLLTESCRRAFGYGPPKTNTADNMKQVAKENEQAD